MTVGSDTLTFTYDASGRPLSVSLGGTTYYYVTNLQGDVTAILNTSGTAVVTYFRNTGLTRITIPDFVTTIGMFAFTDSQPQELVFEGDAPEFGNLASFFGLTATVYYPADNSTWTEELRLSLAGNLTCVAK